MLLNTLTPTKALNPAYRKEKVAREAIDRLKHELPLLLDRTRGKVGESTVRDHLQTFLRGVAYPDSDYLVQTEVRRMDTVIHDGPKRKDPVGVIIEAKTTENRQEMFSTARPNVKALHELVLYFMRERAAGNTGIKQLMITNGDEVYLFADAEFERLFWNKKRFRKALLAIDEDAGKNNAVAYEHIASHIKGLTDEETLEVTAFHLATFRGPCEDGKPETDERLLPLYKILSPVHLLRRPFAGDSNHLDKRFYRELLHLIGLEERPENPKKKSGKKVIDRLPPGRRHPASLLENTLQIARKEQRFRKVTDLKSYGSDREEREFAVALELCLTWVNRILFLKLLETQLVAYHGGATAYRFLTPGRISDYDALNTLFFDVLNRPVVEREAFVADYARVPYLNSSLFEISTLEDEVIRVNSLKDQHALPLAERSVLGEQGALPPLEYLFRFLDAYDFGGEGRARIQEDNKRLINASVLGLIFEKINGYRDGSFYTPGFITEYMCRETIRRAVVQKFRDDTGAFADFDADDFAALRNYLRRDNYKPEVRLAANALVNSITVCDPAVGSGHFLVSALNELIATKSTLGILGGAAGAVEVAVDAEVVNDELLVSYRRDGNPYEYRVDTDGDGRPRVPPEVQAIQQALFAEKRTLIESCLFGVDLNPNSVKICRLRLWIELLKSAYYVLPPDGRSGQGSAAATPSIAYLQTLPNIDINIKQGNSLISRFALDDDLSGALADSDLTLADYRRAVTDYHRARGRQSKTELLELIERVKSNFETHIGRNDKRRKELARARGKMDEARINVAAAERFGIRDKSVAKDRKVIAKQNKVVAKLEAELAGVENNVIYENAFEWRFEFPAVLGEDGAYLGFDVVVGNPPYVLVQNQAKEVFDFYKASYDTATYKIDTYQLFFELGHHVLSDLGLLIYITPNTFFKNKHAAPLRKMLILENTILEIVNFYFPVFEGASVDVAITSTRKGIIEGSTFAYKIADILNQPIASFNSSFIKQSIFDSNGYSFKLDVNEEELTILTKIDSESNKMSNYFRAYFGIQGINRESNLSDVKLSDNYLPIIHGSDVRPYGSIVPQEFYNYIPKAIKSGGSETVYQLRRIVLRQIGVYPEGTVCDSWVLTMNSLYNLYPVGDEVTVEAILGILNSSLIKFYWLKNYYDNKSTFPKIKKAPVEGLPISKKLINSSDKIENIVTQILHQKAQSPTADTSALEAEIDLLVYRLYGLTHAEVLVVDPEFGMDEAEYAGFQNAV